MPHSRLQCLSVCGKKLRCGHICKNLCSGDCTCQCPTFTGASLRDTDFDAPVSAQLETSGSPSKRNNKLNRAAPTQAYMMAQAAETPSTTWKVANYVGSLDNPQGPSISPGTTIIQETYRQVRIDSQGNRVVGKEVVWNGAAPEKHAAMGSLLEDGDDFPSLAAFQGSLPLVPHSGVPTQARTTVSTTPVHSTQGVSHNGQTQVEEEEDLLIDLS